MALSLFEHRAFAMGGTVAFIYGMALFGSTYLVPVFMQEALHLPPSQAGAVLLPAGLVLALTIPIAGRLADRIAVSRMVSVGLVLLAFSFFLMLGVGTATSLALITLWAVIGRLGLGMILPSLNLGSMQGVANALIAQGSSTINFLRQLGGAAGIGLVGNVLEWRCGRTGRSAARVPRNLRPRRPITACASVAAWRMGPARVAVRRHDGPRRDHDRPGRTADEPRPVSFPSAASARRRRRPGGQRRRSGWPAPADVVLSMPVVPARQGLRRRPHPGCAPCARRLGVLDQVMAGARPATLACIGPRGGRVDVPGTPRRAAGSASTRSSVPQRSRPAPACSRRCASSRRCAEAGGRTSSARGCRAEDGARSPKPRWLVLAPARAAGDDRAGVCERRTPSGIACAATSRTRR